MNETEKEIVVPLYAETKNYFRFQLKDGSMILNLYLPKNEFEGRPENIKIIIRGE